MEVENAFAGGAVFYFNVGYVDAAFKTKMGGIGLGVHNEGCENK